MPIELKNVTHVYSAGSAFQSTAIRNVSVTLNDGEFIAVVGHTGSGKSTLVQHLNGLLKPSEGQILIDGEDLNADKKTTQRLRRKVGMVFQYPEYQLFEETVARDIAFGPKNLGLSAEEIDQRVQRAMQAVHLDYNQYAERSPFELSGGQMRRVAIAGVLAMQPQILILDEPTAGLDPRGRDRILQMIRELHDAGGVTVVMVSHSMDDVARLAERVLVMNKGELIMDGTPREVFRQSDTMEAIGLGVPEAARLSRLLRSRGLDLPDDQYTMEEVRDSLLKLWKEAEKK